MIAFSLQVAGASGAANFYSPAPGIAPGKLFRLGALDARRQSLPPMLLSLRSWWCQPKKLKDALAQNSLLTWSAVLAAMQVLLMCIYIYIYIYDVPQQGRSPFQSHPAEDSAAGLAWCASFKHYRLLECWALRPHARYIDRTQQLNNGIQR